MIEILLICYITVSPFKPVEGWAIAEINNRNHSAAITLKRSVSSGDVIQPPPGCRLDEPTGGTGILCVPSMPLTAPGNFLR